MPGRTAWGYRLRPATQLERQQGAPTSVVEPDPKTAPYIRELFRMVAAKEAMPRGAALWVAGLSDEARGMLVTTVESNGAVADTTVMMTVVKPRTLSPSHVRMILMNQTYAGRFEDGSQGRWEPLVDDETWDAIRTVMDSRRLQRGPISGNYLLTSMIRCPACGGKMAGQMVARKYPRYRCSSNVLGGAHTQRDCKEACASPAAAPAIDQEVLGRVSALLAPGATGNARVHAAMARESVVCPEGASHGP